MSDRLQFLVYSQIPWLLMSTVTTKTCQSTALRKLPATNSIVMTSIAP